MQYSCSLGVQPTQRRARASDTRSNFSCSTAAAAARRVQNLELSVRPQERGGGDAARFSTVVASALQRSL